MVAVFVVVVLVLLAIYWCHLRKNFQLEEFFLNPLSPED